MLQISQRPLRSCEGNHWIHQTLVIPEQGFRGARTCLWAGRVCVSAQVVAYLHGLMLCRVSAAAGQVILAMDPVISIALGYLVNRNETHLGPLGIAGGATLLGACLLASFYARKEH